MQTKNVKLIDVFPNYYIGDGIFDALCTIDSDGDFPWLTFSGVLDIEYIGNHSGEKTVGPLIDRFIKMNRNADQENPYTLTTAQKTSLANILKVKFGNKWKRLYAVEQAEYEPIENYRLEELETPDITRKHSVSDDYIKTNERKTKTDFDVITTSNTDASTYGFNSNSPVPTSEASGDSTVRTIGEANNNVVTDTETQTGYTQTTETGTRTLTRSGNIGVTTSQQMLESEIALWQWNFIESVYADIDTILTIQIYD